MAGVRRPFGDGEIPERSGQRAEIATLRGEHLPSTRTHSARNRSAGARRRVGADGRRDGHGSGQEESHVAGASLNPGRYSFGSEWLACEDLLEMVRFLSGRVSERKLRLFAASIFRRLAHILPETVQREPVVVLEQMAEGTATVQDRRKATWQARLSIPADTP